MLAETQWQVLKDEILLPRVFVCCQQLLATSRGPEPLAHAWQGCTAPVRH